MNIDEKVITRIAELSKLEFDSESTKEIQKDLNRILGFIDKLEELDTSEVEPLIFMREEKNILREDDVKETISQDEALQNAPEHDSDYFRVPKVLGNK
jgi:aspartyl-tRNA(Asn)/glutamyl-tRNA(Gln) amidotransferase subunit C